MRPFHADSTRYDIFVSALEVLSKDPQEFVRDKAVKLLHQLLSSKPEGERRLLQALINKVRRPYAQGVKLSYTARTCAISRCCCTSC